jgi:hypothetical protein
MIHDVSSAADVLSSKGLDQRVSSHSSNNRGVQRQRYGPVKSMWQKSWRIKIFMWNAMIPDSEDIRCLTLNSAANRTIYITSYQIVRLVVIVQYGV